MQKILLGFLFCSFTYFCNAQSIAFRGIPSVKIVEAGLERGVEKIEQSKALLQVGGQLILQLFGHQHCA